MATWKVAGSNVALASACEVIGCYKCGLGDKSTVCEECSESFHLTAKGACVNRGEVMLQSFVLSLVGFILLLCFCGGLYVNVVYTLTNIRYFMQKALERVFYRSWLRKRCPCLYSDKAKSAAAQYEDMVNQKKLDSDAIFFGLHHWSRSRFLDWTVSKKGVLVGGWREFDKEKAIAPRGYSWLVGVHSKFHVGDGLPHYYNFHLLPALSALFTFLAMWWAAWYAGFSDTPDKHLYWVLAMGREHNRPEATPSEEEIKVLAYAVWFATGVLYLVLHALSWFSATLSLATKEGIDKNNTTMQDYALHINGIPTTMTDERSLKEIITKAFPNIDIVGVSIGYNLTDPEVERTVFGMVERLLIYYDVKRNEDIELKKEITTPEYSIDDSFPQCTGYPRGVCRDFKTREVGKMSLEKDAGILKELLEGTGPYKGRKLQGSGHAFLVFRWKGGVDQARIASRGFWYKVTDQSTNASALLNNVTWHRQRPGYGVLKKKLWAGEDALTVGTMIQIQEKELYKAKKTFRKLLKDAGGSTRLKESVDWQLDYLGNRYAELSASTKFAARSRPSTGRGFRGWFRRFLGDRYGGNEDEDGKGEPPYVYFPGNYMEENEFGDDWRISKTCQAKKQDNDDAYRLTVDLRPGEYKFVAVVMHNAPKHAEKSIMHSEEEEIDFIVEQGESCTFEVRLTNFHEEVRERSDSSLRVLTQGFERPTLRKIKWEVISFDAQKFIELDSNSYEPPSIMWYRMGTRTKEIIKRLIKAVCYTLVLFIVCAVAFDAPIFLFIVMPYAQLEASPSFLTSTLDGSVLGIVNVALGFSLWMQVEKCGFWAKYHIDMFVLYFNCLMAVFNTAFWVVPAVRTGTGGWMAVQHLQQTSSGQTNITQADISEFQNAFAKEKDLHTMLMNMLVPGFLFIGFFVGQLCGRTIMLALNFILLQIVYVFKCLPKHMNAFILKVIPWQPEDDMLEARKAELIFQAQDLGLANDYATLIITPLVCFLSLFALSDVAWRIFGAMLVWTIFMYSHHRFITLRISRKAMHASLALQQVAHILWGVPLASVASAFGWWSWRLGFTDSMAFGLWFGGFSLAIYWLGLYYIYSNDPTHPFGEDEDDYYSAAKWMYYDWFNTNPMHVLKSNYKFKAQRKDAEKRKAEAEKAKEAAYNELMSAKENASDAEIQEKETAYDFACNQLNKCEKHMEMHPPLAMVPFSFGKEYLVGAFSDEEHRRISEIDELPQLCYSRRGSVQAEGSHPSVPSRDKSSLTDPLLV